MELKPNTQTTLHIGTSNDTGDVVATVISPNQAYLTMKFLKEANVVLLGTQTSPEAQDLFMHLKPVTVFAANATDMRELAGFLVMVADALEKAEGNVGQAAADLFTPKKEEEAEEEEKPKAKRKTRLTKKSSKNQQEGEANV